MRAVASVALLLAGLPAWAEGPAVPEAVVRGLADPAPAARIDAARAARKLGVEVVPLLVRALEDPDARVRQEAAGTLLGLKAAPADLTAALTPHAKSARPAVREVVVVALGRGGPLALPALLAGARDPEPSVRALAGRGLGRVGAADGPSRPAAREALIRLAADGEAAVRAEAVLALGVVGAPAAEVTPTLRQRLTDDKAHVVRRAALQTLAGLGQADVTLAAAALADPAAEVQLLALRLLGKRRKEAGPALPALRQAATSAASPGVRTAAVALLGSLGADGQAAVRTLLKSDQSATRLARLQHLARQDDIPKDCVADVTRCLTDPDEDVIAVAAEVLGRLGPAARPALPALEKAGQAGSEAVRLAVGRALRQVRGD